MDCNQSVHPSGLLSPSNLLQKLQDMDLFHLEMLCVNKLIQMFEVHNQPLAAVCFQYEEDVGEEATPLWGGLFYSLFSNMPWISSSINA